MRRLLFVHLCFLRWFGGFGCGLALVAGGLSCQGTPLCNPQTCPSPRVCHGDMCTCAAPLQLCADACRPTQSDLAHCGRCGNACLPGQFCIQGVCKIVCPASQTVCGGQCISLERDPLHCGACGKACPDGLRCQDGRCACAAPLQACAEGCVDVRAHGRHCGGCDQACPAGQVCADGLCTATCPAATPSVCVGGCVALERDTQHCGGCGKACEAGLMCLDSRCACPDRWTLCNEACVDLRTDPQNCGTCGQACGSGSFCGNGACVTTCPLATPSVCFGGCFDLQTHARHCGGCGNICKTGETCIAGVCSCPDGGTACDGRCVHLKSDPQNCGTCGTICGAGESCNDGRCKGQCEGMLRLCDGTCVDIQTDAAHCGTCKKPCRSGFRCLAGVCESSVETLAGSPPFRDGPASQAFFSDLHGMVNDAAGNLYLADTSNHRIRKLDTAGLITTIAGSGSAGFQDGLAAEARFFKPQNLALDTAGNLYIADTGNNRIRKLDTQGRVTTIAGQGTAGFQDGAAAQAKFFLPQGLAFDTAGNLYIADTNNHRIRKLDTAGQVATFSGDGTSGFQDGPGAQARFSSPRGLLSIGPPGTLYVADTANHRIRKVRPDGSVSPLLGSGIQGFLDGSATDARFSSPYSLLVDPTGGLYIVDTGNHRLRKLDTGGQVTTVAGDGKLGFRDGAAAQARFFSPHSVAFDAAGDLIVTDIGNHRLRKLDNQGLVTTIAGNDFIGFRDGPAAQALFALPIGLTRDTAGNLYITDSGNHRIRKLDTAGQVTTLAGDGIAGIREGAGLQARFSQPHGLVRTSEKEFLVTDTRNHRVRKLDSLGVVSTIAGDGTAGFQDGLGSQARFSLPRGIVLDTAGDGYIADTGNHRLRKLDKQGQVTTVAGDGTPGFRDGAAAQARFFGPFGLAFDRAGNLYIADTSNNRIRKLDKQGEVTTVAGEGTEGFRDGPASQARFSSPRALVAEQDGVLYIIDSGNHRLRKIDSQGNVTTIAGNGEVGFRDGLASQAIFSVPYGGLLDEAGNLFVVDTGNHLIRLWRP